MNTPGHVTATEHLWAAAPVKIIYGPGNDLQMQTCQLYLSHKSAILQSHHVCPESWWRAAGKPVASPLMNLCPVCHYNTHAGIDTLLKNGWPGSGPPDGGISCLPPRVQELAHKAFALAQENGLTPARTL